MKVKDLLNVVHDNHVLILYLNKTNTMLTGTKQLILDGGISKQELRLKIISIEAENNDLVVTTV